MGLGFRRVPPLFMCICNKHVHVLLRIYFQQLLSTAVESLATALSADTNFGSQLCSLAARGLAVLAHVASLSLFSPLGPVSLVDTPASSPHVHQAASSDLVTHVFSRMRI
jgi:hypothetical protein